MNEIGRPMTLTPGYANDHRVSLARGGGNELSNRQMLCATCHAWKTIHERPNFRCASRLTIELLAYMEAPYTENE